MVVGLVMCAMATTHACLVVSRAAFSAICAPCLHRAGSYFHCHMSCRRFHVCGWFLHGRKTVYIPFTIAKVAVSPLPIGSGFMQVPQPMMRSQPRNISPNDWLPTAYLVTENTCSSFLATTRQRCARMMEGEEAAAQAIVTQFSHP